MGGDLHIVSPRKVPSGHGRESSVLYLHSPSVRPMANRPDARGPLSLGLPSVAHEPGFNDEESGAQTVFGIARRVPSPNTPRLLSNTWTVSGSAKMIFTYHRRENDTSSDNFLDGVICHYGRVIIRTVFPQPATARTSCQSRDRVPLSRDSHQYGCG